MLLDGFDLLGPMAVDLQVGSWPFYTMRANVGTTDEELAMVLVSIHRRNVLYPDLDVHPT